MNKRIYLKGHIEIQRSGIPLPDAVVEIRKVSIVPFRHAEIKRVIFACENELLGQQRVADAPEDIIVSGEDFETYFSEEVLTKKGVSAISQAILYLTNESSPYENFAVTEKDLEAESENESENEESESEE